MHRTITASSRLPSHEVYGARGEFLFALSTLALVEIESKVDGQWSAHRKRIEVLRLRMQPLVNHHLTRASARCLTERSALYLPQNGVVTFNARSDVQRKGRGTTVTVRSLFNALPVRAIDLQSNPRHCAKLAKAIQHFCATLSLIWPTLSLELAFERTCRVLRSRKTWQ